ncbi:sigma-70 family RNA polymerase sigma factor [Actinomadura sp. KC06]|uniref:sigma-70 family RNA polymerase sigma factor n=1 Tax=Actinomadura sp. KC06 TaxID=2530369 RepID=UPI001051AE22|nr:sigma-70 family RNA polymerase sigma factor [Actinomadura sp. KC06]TDD37149.1 sigma-70 family RNA polymerase sigma factor [Actinomadura sp. KC06]
MSSLSLDAGVLPRPRPPRGGFGPLGTAGLRGTDRTIPGRDAADRTAEQDSGRAEILKALVLRARDGDAEAFGSLYDHYVELVYRYVYYRVGTHSLTEDLTSETFLRALRRICDFHWQGKDFGAWLVTIARNLVADHFKSSRYRLEVCTAELVEPDRHQEGPERAVLDSMTNRTLLEAVRRLGSEQQECIVLRFLHGLSVAETALVMGKKTGAIKALQYRAVRSLGRMLPDDLRH